MPRVRIKGRRITGNARCDWHSPGDYSLQTWEGHRYWTGRDPAGGFGSFAAFRVIGHRDGSISVVGRIFNRAGSWNGWLKRGRWIAGKPRPVILVPRGSDLESWPSAYDDPD